jgi:hypothetical protein
MTDEGWYEPEKTRPAIKDRRKPLFKNNPGYSFSSSAFKACLAPA